MNKTAIIVHGKPSREGYFNPDTASPSNAIWIPWLQKRLLLKGISAQTPEMLNAFQPDYAIWNKTIEGFKVDQHTTLIGHSCGGGFLIQWLSERPDLQVGDVFLIAPAFGDTLVDNLEDKYDDPLLNGFFDFTPDPKLIERTKSLHVLYSDNDSIRVDRTIKLLKQSYPSINQHTFSNYGHFTAEPAIKNGQFPELLELIESTIDR